MNRDVKHCVILVEDICSSITNMHVPVKNDDLLFVEVLLSNSCSSGNVVEEAKASDT
jgi:hypothetical protein